MCVCVCECNADVCDCAKKMTKYLYTFLTYNCWWSSRRNCIISDSFPFFSNFIHSSLAAPDRLAPVPPCRIRIRSKISLNSFRVQNIFLIILVKEILRLVGKRNLGSISSTFYEQLLHTQTPKAQKRL